MSSLRAAIVDPSMLAFLPTRTVVQADKFFFITYSDLSTNLMNKSVSYTIILRFTNELVKHYSP
ncbi:hypothetical protein FC49_GL000305 [Limosilactobacillus oris DSM 4864]|uniref:Uncharacterized protein n=1 Tax=Limosilactobacillus oris DSM 4864 TaxID=1423779 RepID=A0A0R1WKK2_9LACO|nr:hypothetical protein FC49_GL000305 [Limosilactobacillus oris DSM 4864]